MYVRRTNGKFSQGSLEIFSLFHNIRNLKREPSYDILLL